MEMRRGRKVVALYGPSEEDFLPAQSCGSASVPAAAGNVVPFSQPLDAIALGMQLVQVLPILQQVLQRQTEIFGQMKSMQVQISGMQKPDADQPEWLDAEGARTYLSMSKNTFQKHVYSAEVKIRRYPVGGKNYFKKSELDLFMLTWEDKNLS
jgi:hypothetical protein